LGAKHLRLHQPGHAFHLRQPNWGQPGDGAHSRRLRQRDGSLHGCEYDGKRSRCLNHSRRSQSGVLEHDRHRVSDQESGGASVHPDLQSRDVAMRHDQPGPFLSIGRHFFAHGSESSIQPGGGVGRGVARQHGGPDTRLRISNYDNQVRFGRVELPDEYGERLHRRHHHLRPAQSLCVARGQGLDRQTFVYRNARR